ncbi:hypothetical protein [Streptomyces violaceus]|uniref:Integral membrane protein n=1 Tax=Streptomyces violaceus TaxID=1936 RepID=A0ABY9U381_STRVL|nr:hypothetical protein [Streptomyces janthinus]WND16767.1 hypothetical protein RI060_05060 [Streptomyces janthinus]GGS43087.1 hypothetical protein GCM10010270_11660 [Streptomyces janthinus]
MSDRLHVLTAIYQSDRSDRSTALTVSLATVAAAVTYLIGTIAFYDKLDLLGWTICLLPSPLFCVAAFQAHLVNLAAVRARSILILERTLLDAVESPGSTLDRDVIGVAASERASNLHTATTSQRAVILLAYGGVGLIYLAYTALLLAKATRHMDAWIAVPAVCYAVLLVFLVLAWRDCVRSLVL